MRMMLRLAGCLLIVLGAAEALAGESAAESVRQIYQTEIGHHLARDEETQEQAWAIFTPRTRAAQIASLKGPGPKSEGPILHPLFGWGVFPGQDVALIAMAPAPNDGALARMTITLLIRGRMRYATVQARMIGGSWLIDDVSYDEGEGLRPYLLRCAAAPC